MLGLVCAQQSFLARETLNRFETEQMTGIGDDIRRLTNNLIDQHRKGDRRDSVSELEETVARKLSAARADGRAAAQPQIDDLTARVHELEKLLLRSNSGSLAKLS